MTPVLRVLKTGPGATIQDSGRRGYLRYGVTIAGPMDWQSHARANILAGNPLGEGAIEVAVGGIEIMAEDGDIALGYAGGAFAVSQEGRPLPAMGRVQLGSGQRLTIKAGRLGSWFYLSAAGGLAVPPVLGSVATSLRTGIGGIEGRALIAGDAVRVRHSSGMPELSLDQTTAAPRRIRVVPGPQDDHFSPAGLATFYGHAYRVSARSDRMGYVLEGPAIGHAGGFNIVSDGIAPGAIQVPGDGRPIVLMADCQPTGGYPKIGHVIRADIGYLAQCRPGDSVRFAAVTVEEARAELLACLRALHSTLQHAASPGGADLSSEFLLSQTLISGVSSAWDTEDDARDAGP